MKESELLFSYLLGCDRVTLYHRRDSVISRDNSLFVAGVLKRRISGEPIQYILCEADFFGLDFEVNPSVFIPRPETEILVEKAIAISSELKTQNAKLKILDLGTGCGCIAICLARYISGAEITASDISPEGLDIAAKNAWLYGVDIRFVQSNMFAGFSKEEKFDIVVSNPPYVQTQQLKTLQPEIQHEPRIALDGGSDGLDYYRIIARQAFLHLKKGGFLILEIGWDQGNEVKTIFRQYRHYQTITLVKDYSQLERVTIIRKPN